MRVALATLAFTVFLALFCIAADYASAATDEQRLGLWRQPVERAIRSYTPCKTVTYHLRADAILDRTFPPTPFEHADGMAWGCQVWIRRSRNLWSGNFRYVLTHEVLHTAGWQHGAAMDAAVARLCRGPGPVASRKRIR